MASVDFSKLQSGRKSGTYFARSGRYELAIDWHARKVPFSYKVYEDGAVILKSTRNFKTPQGCARDAEQQLSATSAAPAGIADGLRNLFK